MMHGGEDEIISIMNSGRIIFKRLSFGDKNLPTSEQLYVRVTYRCRDQEGVRDLYLKGQPFVCRSNEPVFQNAKTHPTSPSPPVHEISSTEQTGQQPVAHLPLLSINATSESGSTEDMKNESNTFGKNPTIEKQFLNQNLRQHTGDKAYKCSQCDKTFLRSRYMKMHMETAHSVTYNLDSPYQCNICIVAFKNKHEFEEHVNNVVHVPLLPNTIPSTGNIPNENNIFEKVSSTQKQVYSQHQRPHTGEKTYKCNRCVKVLTNKEDFTLHIADHNTQSSYVCTKCQKTFSNNEDFMLHMYIHTGKKPYPCNQCNMSFLQNSNLKKHLETHMGHHSLKINQCSPDIFLKSNNLEDHMNVHMEESQCNDCGKAFLRTSIVNGDIRIKIEDNQDRCNQCHRSVSQDRTVINHTYMQTLEMVESPNKESSIEVKQEEIGIENSLTHIVAWETLAEGGLI